MSAHPPVHTSIIARLNARVARMGRRDWLKLPALTAGEQTRLSWTRVIESPEQAPEAFREALARALPEGSRPFPYMLLTPAREGFLNRTNPKLIWMASDPEGDRIYILETVAGRVDSTCYDRAGVEYLEAGTVLLKSWITIRGHGGGASGPAGRGRAVSAGGPQGGQAGAGRPQGLPLQATRIEFNTVNEHLFRPFLERMRPEQPRAPVGDLEHERAKFDYLGARSYKFMNYARRTIRSGEIVRGCLMQEEVRRPVLRIFGRSFYRTVAAAHFSLLTERELVCIEEADSGRPAEGQAIRYGGIWRYVALERIGSVSLAAREDGCLARRIKLRGGDCLDAIFGADKRDEVEEFQKQLELQLREQGGRQRTEN